MDIFTTLLSLAGVTPPADRRYDGMDATDVLLHGKQTGHEVIQHFVVSMSAFLPFSYVCFFCSSSSTLTVALQVDLATYKRSEEGNTKLSTSQVFDKCESAGLTVLNQFGHTQVC